MDSGSKYKTKQRRLLIEYFETVPKVHITAADICDHFRKQGISIGQSTVYRQLESLVDEGVISKYIIDANTPACFEYTGPEAHGNEESCFHCKCEKCGVLIHLHCDDLTHIQSHLYSHHHFTLNPMRTVFYGLCEKCAAMPQIQYRRKRSV